MDFDEYQLQARRTLPYRETSDDLAMLAMGLAGESGEVVELIKKHLYHGHDLDTERIAKELGDVLWYLSGLAYTLNLRLGGVAEANIHKLRQRYPHGFSESASKNRQGD